LIPRGSWKGFVADRDAKIFEGLPFFNERELKNVGNG